MNARESKNQALEMSKGGFGHLPTTKLLPWQNIAMTNQICALNVAKEQQILASFPGLPTIKNWMVGMPGNEVTAA